MQSPAGSPFIPLLLLAFVTSMASASAADAPLADAVERRDRHTVEKLLERGVDVDAEQVDGMTALHWAAYFDDTELVDRLIRSGADATAENHYGVTPLSLACTNGNAAVVELLLDAGADADSALRGGETPLMIAARTGRLPAVEALLARGAVVDATERNDQTALMWATAAGHADVVTALLDVGADLHRRLDSGFTPLFFAIREGHVEVVRTLLAAGADINDVMRPQRPTKKGPDKGTSPLVLAIENGHFELAAELLSLGADPNDLRSGYGPLHVLTWVRKPNRGDGADGDPSPIGSGSLSSRQLARVLVDHGADVNLRLERGKSGRGKLNEVGATPFFMAADTADVPYMKLLLELGADPFLPNADNCTPLLAAAGLGTTAPGEEAGTEEEALAAVRLLLELGADINHVDDNGETAMHGAAYKSLPSVVQFLADHGADIEVWNRKNKYGWTPLLIAQGFRPGNFRPLVPTIEAIERLMRAAGVEPPPPPKRDDGHPTGYENR